MRYIHVDAQGSIMAMSEGNPTTQIVVERLSYDAWGKRRNPDGTDDNSNNLQGVNTDHGYTGHEHLDDVGLIHMNGRVYDPRLGRFISADPYIQSPGDLQSYNRYSYVMNNPFMYTDPSGFVGDDGGGFFDWVGDMASSFFDWASGSGGGDSSFSNMDTGNSNSNSVNNLPQIDPNSGQISSSDSSTSLGGVKQSTFLDNLLFNPFGWFGGNGAGTQGEGASNILSQNSRNQNQPSEHVLDNAKDIEGKKVIDFNGDGVAQCAELLRANGAPPASTWQEGHKITRDSVEALGTAVGTMVNGRYPDNTTGQHSGYIMGKNSDGIFLLEQYRGLPVIQIREVPWEPRRPGLGNNGSAYSTIIW